MAKIKYLAISCLLFALPIFSASGNLPKTVQENKASKNVSITDKKNAAYLSNEADEYDAKKQPKKALSFIEEAVYIEPNNLYYLHNEVELANELDDYVLEEKIDKHILELKPNDQAALLSLATTANEANHLDEAVEYFKLYLALYPNDKKTWIHYSEVQAWRDNFRVALAILEEYHNRFGDTDDYIEHKARIYASAGWGNTALALIDPLVLQYPDNYEYILTKTIAEGINESNEIEASLTDLEKLKRMDPKNSNTKEAEGLVAIPLEDFISVTPIYRHSSDTISAYSIPTTGQIALTPLTNILLNFDTEYLTAENGSGYDNINGSQFAKETYFLGGAGSQLDNITAVVGQVGSAWTGNDNSFFIYNFLGDFRISDQAELFLQQSRNIYDISPRSVSLGVIDNLTDFRANLNPALQRYINIEAQYNQFSDHNNMWLLEVDPRKRIILTQKISLDLGLSGFWQSFAKDLNDGYYDPPWYQRYFVTSAIGYQHSDIIYYSCFANVGANEERPNGWGPAFDVGGSTALALNRDWEIVWTVDWFREAQASNSTYNGFETRVEITRRLGHILPHRWNNSI